MSFIKHKRQVTLSPIGVRSFDDGSENVWNAVSEVAETFRQHTMRDAIAKGREEAENAAYAINSQAYTTFDDEGKPLALKVPEEYGRIRREVFLNITNQKYDQIVAKDIKNKSREFALKFPDPEAYNSQMKRFIEAKFGAAEGRFKQTVFNAASEEIAERKFDLEVAAEKRRIEQLKEDAKLNYVTELETLNSEMRGGLYYGAEGLAKYEEQLQKVVDAESLAFQVTNNITEHTNNRVRRQRISAFYEISKLSELTKKLDLDQKEAIKFALGNINAASLIDNQNIRDEVIKIVKQFDTLDIGSLQEMYSGNIDMYQSIDKAAIDQANNDLYITLKQKNNNTSEELAASEFPLTSLDIAIDNYLTQNKTLSSNPDLNSDVLDEAEDFIRRSFQEIIEDIPPSVYDENLIDSLGQALASNQIPTLEDYLPAAMDDDTKRLYTSSLKELVIAVEELHKANIPQDVRNNIFKNLKNYNDNRIKVEKDNNSRLSAKEAALINQEKMIAESNKEAFEQAFNKKKVAAQIANANAFGKYETMFESLLDQKKFDEAAEVMGKLDAAINTDFLSNDQHKKLAELREKAKTVGYKKDEYVKNEHKRNTQISLTSEIQALEMKFILNKDDPDVIAETKSLINKINSTKDSIDLDPSTLNTLLNPAQALLEKAINHKKDTKRNDLLDNYSNALLNLKDYNFSGDAEELKKLSNDALDAFSKLEPQVKEDKLAALNKAMADKIEPLLFNAISKGTNGRGFSEDQLTEIEQALRTGDAVEFMERFAGKAEAAALEILGAIRDTDINIDPVIEGFKSYARSLRNKFDRKETLARNIDRASTLGSSAGKEDINVYSEVVLNPLLGDGSSNPVNYFSTKGGAFFEFKGGEFVPSEYMKELDPILNSGLIPREIIDFLEMSATNPPQTTEGQQNLFDIYSKLTQGGAVGTGYNLLNNKNMPHQLSDSAKAILGAAYVDYEVLRNAGGSSSFGLSLVRIAGEASQMEKSFPEEFKNVIGKDVKGFLRDNFGEADVKTQRLLTNISYALLPNIRSEDMLTARLNKFIEVSYGKDDRMLGPTLSGSVAKARSLRFTQDEIRKMDDGIEQAILDTLDAYDEIRLTKSKKSTIKTLLEVELGGLSPLTFNADWKLTMLPNSDNMAQVMVEKNGRYEPYIYTEQIEQDGQMADQELPMIVNLLDYVPYPKADMSRLTETYYTRYRAIMQEVRADEPPSQFTLNNFMMKAIGMPTKEDLFQDPTGGTDEGAAAFMAYQFSKDPSLLLQEENKEVLKRLVKENFMTEEDANILVGASGAD